MTKCNSCGARLKKENVNITRYFGKDLIALEDVPALVCTQCGERYFEAKVSSEIDKKIQQAIKRKSSLPQINIPVVQF